jgi:hypothetical protein
MWQVPTAGLSLWVRKRQVIVIGEVLDVVSSLSAVSPTDEKETWLWTRKW